MDVADLKVFVQTRWFRSGQLDYIPTDLVDTLAPALAASSITVSSQTSAR